MITPTIAGTNQATCCEDDQCTCTNGIGATGTACTAGHGNAQCGSCDDGFYLDSGACTTCPTVDNAATGATYTCASASESRGKTMVLS